jgi:hypothetical protein
MGYKFNPFTGNLDTVDSPDGVFETVEVNGDITLDDGGTYITTLQVVTPTLSNKTISFPDATGTVALIAGSSGQLLYNNAGANAGVSSFTADSSGRLTNSASSASGFPVKLWNGTIFAGTTPHVLVQPSTASAGSWSASGTALGVNTAAAFGGSLLDLQANGTSRVRVTSGGNIFMGGQNTGLEYYNSGLLLMANNSYPIFVETSRTRFAPTYEIAWAASGSTSYGVAADIGLVRSGTNTVKVTNGSTGDGTISGQHRLVGTAPASATATGTAGDIRYDASYIYICTATDTWKRAAIATW